MKNFKQWAEEKNIELPDLSENRVRTGVGPQYPDAYVRGQYPGSYFPPAKATAVLDLKNAEKTKAK